jgi:hypothetical protein
VLAELTFVVDLRSAATAASAATRGAGVLGVQVIERVR